MPPAELRRRSVLVLLAHPRPGSLNHAVATAVVEVLQQRGLDVHLHDLYAEGFDPVLRAGEAFTSGMRAADVLAASHDPLVAEHRRHLAAADALVAVHPNWWGKPPAIMAGWLDRVLVPGVAYRLEDAGGAPESLLRLREVLVVNTSDTPAEREAAVFGDPLDAIWRRCLPPYLGSPSVRRLVLSVASDAGPAQVARWLAEVTACGEALLARPVAPTLTPDRPHRACRLRPPEVRTRRPPRCPGVRSLPRRPVRARPAATAPAAGTGW